MTKYKFIVAAVLAFVAALAAAMASAAVPLYLQIDGRWYETTPGTSVTLSFGTLDASGVTLSACHRTDFTQQSSDGIWLFYGPYYDSIMDIQSLQWRVVENQPASRVIVLRTSDSNVVCTNEVVSPETGTYFVDPIYANGFE